MKTMIIAAVAALSIGSAFAGEDGGINANTEFTDLPGVVAQAPVSIAIRSPRPSIATAFPSLFMPPPLTIGSCFESRASNFGLASLREQQRHPKTDAPVGPTNR